MSSAVHPFQEQQAPDEGINNPLPSGNSNPQSVSGVPAAYGIAPPGIAGHSYGAPPASVGGCVYFYGPPPESFAGGAPGNSVYVYSAPHPGGYVDCAQTYPGGTVLGYHSGAPGYPIRGSNSAGCPVESSSNSVITPINLSSPVRASDDPVGSPGNPVYAYGAPHPSAYLGGAPTHPQYSAPGHPSVAPGFLAGVQNNAEYPVGASDDPTSAGPPVGASGDPIEAPVTESVAGYPVQVSPSDFAGAPGNAVGCAPSSLIDAPLEAAKDAQSTPSVVDGTADFNYRPPVDVDCGHSLLKSAISQPPPEQATDPRDQIETGRWEVGLLVL